MDNKTGQEKLYARNFRKFGLDMNIFVTLVSAFLVLGFITFTILRLDQASSTFEGMNNYLNKNFNWLYVATINGSLIFLLFIGLSKYGKIRLGGYTATPEYNNIAWYAMMFSAGIGIGIFSMV